MGDLVHNNYLKSKYTKFVSVNCADVDEAISIFGNFTPQGDTPIACMPERSSCKPYITIPEGTYAVVVKHGNFQGILSINSYFTSTICDQIYRLLSIFF